MNNTNFSKTEIALQKIWLELFGNIYIDRETDFFDIGGNSLNALTLLSKINELFGEDALTPDALFADGKLKVLAEHIDNKN